MRVAAAALRVAVAHRAVVVGRPVRRLRAANVNAAVRSLLLLAAARFCEWELKDLCLVFVRLSQLVFGKNYN